MVGVIEVIMGVPALAQLFGQAVLQAAEIWKNMRDAPQELRDRATDIRNLDKILAGIDSEPSHIHGTTRLPRLPDQSLVNRSADCSHEALNALRMIVEELNNDMRSAAGFRKIFMKGKVVRKRRLIDDLEHRLEKALGRLQLAMECHSL